MRQDDQGIEWIGKPKLGLLGPRSEETIFDMQRLLSVYDDTKDADR